MKNSAGNKRVLDCLSMNSHLLTRESATRNNRKYILKSYQRKKTDYLNGTTDWEHTSAAARSEDNGVTFTLKKKSV